MAWEPAHDDIGMGNFGGRDAADVAQDDVVADVERVCRDGVFVEIVRPNHFVTGLDQALVQTSSARKK